MARSKILSKIPRPRDRRNSLLAHLGHSIKLLSLSAIPMEATLQEVLRLSHQALDPRIQNLMVFRAYLDKGNPIPIDG
jgi:hypothetical protein